MPSTWREGGLTLITAVVVALFGNWSPALTILIGFMVADYVTGMISGSRNEGLDSKVGFKGITKKLFMLGIVAMGYQLDLLLGMSVLRDICAYFYLANEALSIIENAAEIGVPLPDALIDAIKRLKDRAEPEKDGDGNG